MAIKIEKISIVDADDGTITWETMIHADTEEEAKEFKKWLEEESKHCAAYNVRAVYEIREIIKTWLS